MTALYTKGGGMSSRVRLARMIARSVDGDPAHWRRHMKLAGEILFDICDDIAASELGGFGVPGMSQWFNKITRARYPSIAKTSVPQ